MSYEGPDSLDGGVALFFRLGELKVAACQKKSCVLCARGYVRGAWEDKITLGKVQVAVATAMKVKRRAGALSWLFLEVFN